MNTPSYRLYHYWRSSASWRVRIALAWKKIEFESIPVNLLDGESESPAHLKRNPAGFVPVLELNRGPHAGEKLTESLAIIRYLEETHPEAPTLFPGTAFDRAKIWALAEVVNSGTQPFQNISVMEKHSVDGEEQKRWSIHWITHGLEVFETLIQSGKGQFSHGDHFSLADTCLIPQVYSAKRYDIDLSAFPKLKHIYETSLNLPAIVQSHPDRYKP
jgi:maleylacetoacetate isomerase